MTQRVDDDQAKTLLPLIHRMLAQTQWRCSNKAVTNLSDCQSGSLK